MKQHLNTLFITTQGSYLRKEGENVVVSVARQERARMPIHTLGSIVCFGQVTCSPFLMGFCGQRGVSLAFLTERGRFLARVEGPISGNVLLRREQYRRADCPNMAAELARAFVIGKVANSRTTLQRAARDHADKSYQDALQPAIDALGRVLREVSKPLPLDVVRGKEGEAARLYFAVFDYQITAQKDAFSFAKRTRRPPEDNVNALLSFLYTLLLQDVRSACEATGLDPQVGFLHRDRPGRPGLALDLMEEFRAMLADRLALSLINRRQVAPKSFKQTESGGVHMDDETRKTVLVAYQKRKMESIVHPFLNEKLTVGLLPHVQARLLSRYLRGDLDAYPPLLWK